MPRLQSWRDPRATRSREALEMEHVPLLFIGVSALIVH